jgi:NAD(P)-dependent dehydrogenase (short-subunit alcohol dehydrogenase family)
VACRQICVLVNTAGLGRSGGFAAKLPPANMVAATFLLKRAVADMQGHGAGRVLNVASTAAFLPGPHMAVYHATKPHRLALSEGIAEKLRGTGVPITALRPGATDTAFFIANNTELPPPIRSQRRAVGRHEGGQAGLRDRRAEQPLCHPAPRVTAHCDRFGCWAIPAAALLGRIFTALAPTELNAPPLAAMPP